jgi:hypothetical protein
MSPEPERAAIPVRCGPVDLGAVVERGPHQPSLRIDDDCIF